MRGKLRHTKAQPAAATANTQPDAGFSHSQTDAWSTNTQPNAALAYVYDGTLEGLLCAIFDSYARREVPLDVCTPKNLQLRLGQEVHTVGTDLKHALRVHDGLIRVCGDEVYEAIRAASLSDEAHTGTTCLTFARYAFEQNRARWKNPRAPRLSVTQDIAHPAVAPLFALERSVYNERHYMLQFLRFEELEGGVWFAKCNPKASVVPLLMDFFSMRFNTMAFIIYDEVHNLAGVYEGGLPQRSRLQSGTKPSHEGQQGDQPQANSSETGTVRASGPHASANSSTMDLHGGSTRHAGRSRRSKRKPRWYLVKSDVLQLPKQTENEKLMQEAWRAFYDAVSIDDRYNPELRRSFMPMRFWDNITEVKPLL
jgi:probable DNA metabolism protein